MDALLVVLIIFGVVGAIVKNAGKTAKNRPGQKSTPAQRMQTARPKVPAAPNPTEPSWADNFPPELREVLANGRRKGTRSAAKPAASRAASPAEHSAPKTSHASTKDGSLPRGGVAGEGGSRVFDDGCIGGSLPHKKTDKPVRVTPRPQSPDTPPAILAASSSNERNPRLTAEEMRRAVVTAELLARPVALRPRGYRL